MEHFVEFPALGWHIPLNDTLVSFTLFGMEFNVKWYGVLIALGFTLAVIYALKRAKYFGIDVDRMIDVVLVCTLVAFIGARLYYVVFSDPETRAAYFADPVTILQVWKGGLGIYGGLIFAFLSALLMCRLRKVNVPAMFDLASLGFLIGQAIGRWGNFFNQEAFGSNTALPWGMTGDLIGRGYNGSGFDPSLPVHPTFLYESLWCILGFVLLHLISKKRYKFKGQIFSLYIIWYGAGRFFIELLRTDSLMLGNMKVSCFVAVLAVLGGLMMYVIFRNRQLGLSATLEAEPAEGEESEESEETEETADPETAEIDSSDQDPEAPDGELPQEATASAEAAEQPEEPAEGPDAEESEEKRDGDPA